MKINVITIFPEIFEVPLSTGILGRAGRAGIIDMNIYDLRQFSDGKHGMVDDAAYGGGPGMVLMPQPMFNAVESLGLPPNSPVILLTPQGQTLNQKMAKELSKEDNLTFLCGRYDGVDERITENLVTLELSIGDYVLTGGEIPALVVIDTIVRLIPEVVGKGEDGIGDDTHTSGLVQYPQYTRPSRFRGLEVPSVLLSGNHEEVARWRRRKSLFRTLLKRPELLDPTMLSEEDKIELKTMGWIAGNIPEPDEG